MFEALFLYAVLLAVIDALGLIGIFLMIQSS